MITDSFILKLLYSTILAQKRKMEALELKVFCYPKCESHIHLGVLRTAPGRGGGGVMTLHDYGYQPPEFLKSYPVSERNFQIYTLPRSLAFFQGFLWGIYCYANLFCYANFLLFSNQFFGGGGANCLKKSQQSAEQCNKAQKWVVFKENADKILVLYAILKTLKLRLISWTKDK